MNAYNTKNLLALVQAVWKNSVDLTNFNQELTSHLAHLSQPLKQQSPKDEHRKALESGKIQLPGESGVITVGGDDVAFLLRFSKSLALNEMEVVALARTAAELDSEHPCYSADLHHAFFRLHFVPRRDLLVLLRELIQLYHYNDMQPDVYIDDSVANIVDPIMDKLLTPELLAHLLTSLKDHFRRVQSLPLPEVEPFVLCEMWEIARVLFELCSKIQLSREQAMQLFETVRAMSEFAPVRHSRSRNEATKSLIVYLLLMSVRRVLKDCAMFNAFGNGKAAKNTLLNDANFVRDVNTKCAKGNWPASAPHVEGMFIVLWTHFLHRSGGVSDRVALASRVGEVISTSRWFQGLLNHLLFNPYFRGMATSASRTGADVFVDQQLRVFILSDIRSLVYDTLSMNANDLQNLAQQNLAVVYPIPRWQLKEHHCGDFYSFLTLLTELCQADAHLVRRLWETQVDLVAFIDTVSQFMSDSPFFQPYTHLLVALAQHGCGDRLFMFLTSSGKTHLSLPNLLTVLQETVRVFSAQQQQQQPQQQQYGGVPAPADVGMDPSEVRYVSGCLRILRAALLHPSSRDMVYRTHPGLAEVFFSLLACKLPSSIKAEALRCLAQFVVGNEALAQLVWHKLEESQLLRTWEGVSSGESVVEELENREKKEGRYSLTVATLTLLRCLLKCSRMPQLGAGKRSVTGVGPYVEFVQRVLLPSSGWLYASEMDEDGRTGDMDRWELQGECMSVLLSLLHEYEPSMHPDAQVLNITRISRRAAGEPSTVRECDLAATVMYQLLSENGQLLTSVVDVIEAAHSAMQSLPALLPTHRPVYTTLCLALKLLNECLTKEQDFIRVMQPRGVRTVSLCNLLLRNSNAIITISNQVAFPFDLPPVAAIGHVFDATAERLILKRDVSSLATRLLLQFSVADATMVVKVFQQRNLTRELCASFAAKMRSPLGEGTAAVVQYEEEEEEEKHQEQDDGDDSGSRTHKVRLEILQLLSSNLHLPMPNLTHLLLGFAQSHHRGLLSPSESPLLDALIEVVQTPGASSECPEVMQKCIELFHMLCSNTLTSAPFLDLLIRHFPYLFLRLLLSLPERKAGHCTPSLATSLMHQRAGLLKSLALVLHVCGEQRQLLGEQGIPEADAILGELGLTARMRDGSLDIAREMYHKGSSLQRRPLLMLEMLDTLQSLTADLQHPPSVNIPAELMESCCMLQSPERGIVEYRIPLLKRMLEEQGHSKQATMEVARRALQANYSNQSRAAAFDMFEGWQQLLEVSLCNAMPADHMETLLFELLLSVLEKLNDTDSTVWHVLCCELAEVAASLMVYIREHGVHAVKHVHRCVAILELSISALLRYGATGREALTRGHLYCVLINFFAFCSPHVRAVNGHYAQKQGELHQLILRVLYSGPVSGGQGSSDHRALLDRVREDADRGASGLQSVAFVFLESLLTLSSQHVANATHSVMSDDEWRHVLRPALHVFLQTLAAKDATLQHAIRDRLGDSAHHLIQFDTLMMLLLKYAQSASGALFLRESMALHVFKECTFLNCRPVGYPGGRDPHAPAQVFMQRYHRVLLPSLQFLVAMVANAPGTDHSVHSQVLEVLSAHHDVLQEVLNQAHPRRYTPLYFLEAADLLCALYAWLYNGSAYEEFKRDKTGPFKHFRHVESMDGHLLRMFSEYAVYRADGGQHDDEDEDEDAGGMIMVDDGADRDGVSEPAHTSEQRTRLVRTTLRSLSSIFRRRCTGHADGSTEEAELLFGPELGGEESLARNGNDGQFKAGLSSVVSVLRSTVHCTVVQLDKQARGIETLAGTSATVGELEALVSPRSALLASSSSSSSDADTLPSSSAQGHDRRVELRQQLQRSMTTLQCDIRTGMFTLENCLLVLLVHVQAYLGGDGFSASRQHHQMDSVLTPVLEGLDRLLVHLEKTHSTLCKWGRDAQAVPRHRPLVELVMRHLKSLL